MPEYYNSNRDPRRNAAPRNPQGKRPPQGRQPARRRKKRTQPRFYVIVAIIAIVLIAALALVLATGKGGDQGGVIPQPTPTPAANASGLSNVTIATHQPEETAQTDDAVASSSAAVSATTDAVSQSSLAALLADESADISSLSEAGMVHVSDLSVNTSLPENWMNVLLLGTDERTLNETSRTDTMIICSINTSTGEVKLTSLMRDTAVEYNDLEESNGTYRISAAHFFGGPEYAMKTVNRLLDMNIEHYVSVNFFGFQNIAQALGGIEVNITEAEMQAINKNAVNQAKIAYAAGIDEPTQINEYLETYGPDTHLNGRQTLAYARIRSVDSDFSRAERQRTVLIKLMEKLKGRNILEILSLLNTLSNEVKTNMDVNDIASIAYTVLNSGLSNVDTLRLPVNGSYVEERRNNDAMLYDCDWTTNSRELYNFIYS